MFKLQELLVVGIAASTLSTHIILQELLFLCVSTLGALDPQDLVYISLGAVPCQTAMQVQLPILSLAQLITPHTKYLCHDAGREKHGTRQDSTAINAASRSVTIQGSSDLPTPPNVITGK